MNNLPIFTPEERKVALEKAQLARIAKREYAEQNLILDYADEKYWRETASSLGVRLPQRYDVGPKGVKKAAKSLGVDIKDFLDTTGCANLKELVDLNPKWSSMALSSLVLEYYMENRNAHDLK